MKKIITVAFLTGVLCGVVSFANEQTNGGWGVHCDSGHITCNDGRGLECQATPRATDQRSECIQHTGGNAWVSCLVYDNAGNVLSQYTDHCP